MRMQEAMGALGASKVTDLSAMLARQPADAGSGSSLKSRPDAGDEPRARLG
jgi:hypothetical protein